MSGRIPLSAFASEILDQGADMDLRLGGGGCDEHTLAVSPNSRPWRAFDGSTQVPLGDCQYTPKVVLLAQRQPTSIYNTRSAKKSKYRVYDASL